MNGINRRYFVDVNKERKVPSTYKLSDVHRAQAKGLEYIQKVIEAGEEYRIALYMLDGWSNDRAPVLMSSDDKFPVNKYLEEHDAMYNELRDKINAYKELMQKLRSEIK